MADLPGPVFWEKHYGYPDFDTFYTEVGRFIPNATVYHVGLTQQTVAEIAWQFPAGVPGIAAQLIAAGRGAGGQDENSALKQQAGANAATIAGGLTGMAQLIIPGAFQVAINAKAGSQDVVNVVGVLNPSGDAAGAANAVKTAWTITGGPVKRLSTLYVLSNFTAVDIGNANGSISVVADSTTGGVSTTNAFATAGACALVKWNGGTRSRSTRGRLYFGPIMETDINPDGRTLAGTPQTGIITGFNTFRSSLAASGYPLVVLSRKMSQAFAVTSSTVESTIATQRRRIRS
jgi:hypothetical protein